MSDYRVIARQQSVNTNNVLLIDCTVDDRWLAPLVLSLSVHIETASNLIKVTWRNNKAIESAVNDLICWLVLHDDDPTGVRRVTSPTITLATHRCCTKLSRRSIKVEPLAFNFREENRRNPVIDCSVFLSAYESMIPTGPGQISNVAGDVPRNLSDAHRNSLRSTFTCVQPGSTTAMPLPHILLKQ